MSIRTQLQQLLEALHEVLDRDVEDPPPQPPAYDQPVDTDDTEGEQHDTAADSNTSQSTDAPADDSTRSDTDSRPTNSSPDNSGAEGKVDLDVEWPPYVGTQSGAGWPTSVPDPVGTIEVRLYWHETHPGGETACRQCVPYILYALLDAWGDRYQVNVQVHPEPVPGDVTTPGEFSSWYWEEEAMAKDANLLVHDLGSGAGRAGGYGGWVDALPYLDGWDFDPDRDPIKNVAAGDGPTRGVLLVLHELGHCLGLGHETREIRAWSSSWVTPMADGSVLLDRSRYAFEYHPSVKRVEPKVQ